MRRVEYQTLGAGRRKSGCHRRRRSQSSRARVGLGERFAEARQRRHRRDHFVHQHVESVGPDRRRTARQESRRERTLHVPPWVKTSLAPGSKVVRDYLATAGLTALSRETEIPHRRLRMHHLHRQLRPAAGRSFEGDRRKRSGRRLRALRQSQLRRTHQLRSSRQLSDVAAAGRRLRARRTHRHRPAQRSPSAKARTAQPVYLADIWPSQREIEEAMQQSISSDMFTKSYGEVFEGDERWRGLSVPKGETYAWEKDSTYIRRAPYFDDMAVKPVARRGHQESARARRARRQRHHRPHLARRLDQERQPRRKIFAGARREAGGLQLLRIAPRQS